MLPSPGDMLDIFSPSSIAPETLWGLFIRIYGMVVCFALGMLYRQIVALGGKDGLFPIQEKLERIKADYPNALERFVRYPTIHWLFHSDEALKNLLLGSSVAGFILTVLGLHSRLGLVIMWVTYLSYSNMLGFIYPWDCLLLESAVLSFFLPLLHPFSLALSQMPLKMVTFSFRMLLFRVLFGFGKFKFIGASTKEFSYLRGFMINQPMPSIFGWLIYQLPLVVHQFSLAIFFLSEMVVPFFYFSTGTWRIAASLITMNLMFVIQLSGNFGFFNLLTGVLCIPVLDGVDTLFSEEGLLSMVFTHGLSNFLIHSTLLSFLLLALFFFPFNSWCTMSFFLWPGLSLPINPIGTLLRWLSPFHLVHAYGVFFPHSSAGARWIPILEGTDEERVEELVEKVGTVEAANDAKSGIQWREYEYAFMTTRTKRMPPFCAPWHERVDQAILYESIGMTPETYLSTLSSGNRMDFNPTVGGSMLSRVATRLLSDNVAVGNLFKTNPFPVVVNGKDNKKKLRAIRISFYLFNPTSFSYLMKTGEYWSKKYVGQHVRMFTRKQVESSAEEYKKTGFTKDSLSHFSIREPELGHPEHYISIQDTPVVKALYGSLEKAISVAQSDKSTLDSSSILATPYGPGSSTSRAPEHLVQRISMEDVNEKFWNGFMNKMHALYTQVCLPESSVSSAAHGVPQLDFEFHLPPGTWSATVTKTLRSREDSPLGGLNAADIKKMEKIAARGTLCLIHRLLPLYHGPGADEMTTSAQIIEATSRRSQIGKQGVLCLRKCKRDTCEVKEHLHLPSFLHLYLFTQHIMLQGRDVFDSVLLAPSTAVQYVRSFSVASSLIFQSIFHPQMLAFHAAKIRMIVRISFPYQLEQSGILPGFLAVYNNFLIREYRNAEEGSNSLEWNLPNVTTPKRYDEVWVVEHDGMTITKANGLIEEETTDAKKGQ